MGSARNSIAKHYTECKFRFQDEKMEILDVIITKDDRDMIRENIEPILEKMNNILLAWRRHGLSLMGKILVFNSLAASQLVYRMSVLPRLGSEYYCR